MLGWRLMARTHEPGKPVILSYTSQDDPMGIAGTVYVRAICGRYVPPTRFNIGVATCRRCNRRRPMVRRRSLSASRGQHGGKAQYDLAGPQPSHTGRGRGGCPNGDWRIEKYPDATTTLILEGGGTLMQFRVTFNCRECDAELSVRDDTAHSGTPVALYCLSCGHTSGVLTFLYLFLEEHRPWREREAIRLERPWLAGMVRGHAYEAKEPSVGYFKETIVRGQPWRSTPGLRSVFGDSMEVMDWVSDCVEVFRRGAWGEVRPEDAANNDCALDNLSWSEGAISVSSARLGIYSLDRLGLTIWVYQRAFETPAVMLPDEER